MFFFVSHSRNGKGFYFYGHFIHRWSKRQTYYNSKGLKPLLLQTSGIVQVEFLESYFKFM